MRSNEAGREAGTRAAKRRADDSIAVVDAAAREVGGDERAGARRSLLDERHVRRAAAERLDPDRAGPGVAVEHARAARRAAPGR